MKKTRIASHTKSLNDLPFDSLCRNLDGKPNKYKNFITKIIGLNSNLDWQYAITDSSNNNDLLNSVAFSFIPKEEKIIQMDFPVLQYPKKVSSLNLDKTPNFSGKLAGIKGQYLLFEDGTVFNVRTYEGYVVKMSL